MILRNEENREAAIRRIKAIRLDQENPLAVFVVGVTLSRRCVKTFVIETAEQRDRLVSFLAKRDLPVQVEIGPVREHRSVSQNSRLWALHALASKETGYTPEELHELMLSRFFGTKQIEVGGRVLTVPLKRSSTRDKAEFHGFLESVEMFYASELGVWLGRDE